MNTKILKYELFSLFFLTVTTLVVFYYRDSMPDNYLTISSGSSYNFFSYYISSFFNFINYYSGPWLFIPCAIYTSFYVAFYSKRADWIDSTLIFAVLASTYSFIHLVYPGLIGRGLAQFTEHFFSSFTLALVFIATTGLFLWGTFRERFTNFFIESYAKLKAVETDSLKENFTSAVDLVKAKLIKARAPMAAIEHNEEAEVSESQEEVVAAPVALKDESQAMILPVYLQAPEVIEEEVEEIKEEYIPTAQELNPLAIPIIDSATLREKLDGFELEEYVDESEISTFKAKSEVINDDAYYNLVSVAAAKKTDHKFSQPEDKYFHDIIFKIQAKLGEFRIQGQIINVLKGPVVDTFEWELGPGEKVSRLTSIAEDLSLALSGSPIRMVYPMKGRTTVGIEVPRNPRDFIFLDEIISTKDFTSTSHQLPLAMGKDAFGEPVVVDLASMPHMLVAGSTGAGKSVFINSVLVSLLIKKSPNQMKLILIDPKQLELALYARLPHLIMPVITEAKTAATALLWACQEMERRYTIMSEFGVRNIEGFNHKLKTAPKENIEKLRKHYEYETEDTYELPYIVVIVDEFADLILTQKGKEIETHICRLAAKARAAGIHLMLATQRPSVDVITGLIKSNFPTRVSFRVTSSTDSRTILNAMGAEKLLGKGDMLYKQGVDTTRIHSAYIEETEIELLTDKLSAMAPSFNPNVMEFLENGGEEEVVTTVGSNADINNGARDEKYDDAVKVVLEHRSASASLLQRRLGVGYNRAANLIEEMESNGIVGPAQGSKPRKVLMAPESNA